MRQVFLEKGLIAVKEVCEPALEEHSVLVCVHYSCISSGTETATIASASNNKVLSFSNIPKKIQKVVESFVTHGLEGTKALIRQKLISNVQALGYSCSGQVIAVGKKVKKVKAGDYVACAGAGFASHADVVCVPENLTVLISDQTHIKEAALTTIGAIALQGIRRAQLQLGETVCVIGLGLLGQIAVQLAKKAGCKVVGIDVIQDRLDLARQLGADVVLHPETHDVIKEIEYITHHYGADATLLTAASLSDALIQQAMQVTRKKGKVVIVGDVGLKLERDPFYQKEIDLLMSCSYGPGRYDATYEKEGQDYPYAFVRWTEQRNMEAFIELIERNEINIKALTQEISLEEAAVGYESLKNRKSLGVIVSYLPKNEEVSTPAAQQLIARKCMYVPAKKDQVRVGFVGAGGFAKFQLMPIVAKVPSVKINAVVDTDITTAINVSRTYGAAKALATDEQLLAEDLVDVVVIASPHKFHSEQIIRALSSGKAVFVEKPMVTDFKQFDTVMSFLKLNQHIPFSVDYNRPFSPFMQKIKKAIARRTTPLVVHYRMNAGYIPKDHWVQTDVGAGQIIGQACHLFDLFCFLTDAQPVSVSVETIRARRDDLFPTDNFSAQISFTDGSICTLLFTAIGHAGLGKERMELFFDGKTIVMDDFLTLQGYGLPHSFNEKVSSMDKGHAILINQFFDAVKEKKPMPISLERLSTVAQLTLVIDQLACQGGGTKELRG